jgi:uncharacterized membrane protein
VRRGPVKRVVFLAGVVVEFLGVLILMNPVSAGDHNCGTALTPKQFLLPQNARICAPVIRRNRWRGAGVVVVGAVPLIVPGPRCLLADD